MKYAHVLSAVALMGLLAGCNQPNNGEQPPASELPTPHAVDSAVAPKAGASATPATTSAPAASAATPSSAATANASAPAPAASSTAYAYDAVKGKALFDDNCSVCHQASGVGVPTAFPPLKGNPAVNDADPTVQIQTILDGKHGSLIAGKKYSGVMPPFASNFSDADIANIANYERSSWGNHGKQVTAAEVAKIRAGH
ncbi:MAG TPA: cytochrome c [Rhodanobacteraceae bacterium]